LECGLQRVWCKERVDREASRKARTELWRKKNICHGGMENSPHEVLLLFHRGLHLLSIPEGNPHCK
jgi:hypothetical protein